MKNAIISIKTQTEKNNNYTIKDETSGNMATLPTQINKKKKKRTHKTMSDQNLLRGSKQSNQEREGATCNIR